MLIDRAIRNFFVNTIGFEVKKSDTLKCDKLFVSKISLGYDDKDIFYDVILDESLLKELSLAMFMQEEIDEQIISDLNNEVANLIIGNLKVLVSENLKERYDLELSTPKFLGEFKKEISKEYDKLYSYLINDSYFAIGEVSYKKALA